MLIDFGIAIGEGVALPRVGPALVRAIDRAMTVDPAGRYPDVAAFRAAVLEALERGGLRRAADPTTGWVQTRRLTPAAMRRT